jgi:predicted RecA/RadA family phage recombinase
MESIFVHEGWRIDYTPIVDVAAGTVIVQNDMIGVTPMPLEANKLGVLLIGGIFAFSKSVGGGTAITAGTILYWDDASNVVTATAGAHKKIGPCTKAATDTDIRVEVLLTQH